MPRERRRVPRRTRGERVDGRRRERQVVHLAVRVPSRSLSREGLFRLPSSLVFARFVPRRRRRRRRARAQEQPRDERRVHARDANPVPRIPRIPRIPRTVFVRRSSRHLRHLCHLRALFVGVDEPELERAPHPADGVGAAAVADALPEQSRCFVRRVGRELAQAKNAPGHDQRRRHLRASRGDAARAFEPSRETRRKTLFLSFFRLRENRPLGARRLRQPHPRDARAHDHDGRVGRVDYARTESAFGAHPEKRTRARWMR